MWIPNQQLKLKMRVKKEKTFRIKTNNQELLIRKQNESDATSWWIKFQKTNLQWKAYRIQDWFTRDFQSYSRLVFQSTANNSLKIKSLLQASTIFPHSHLFLLGYYSFLWKLSLKMNHYFPIYCVRRQPSCKKYLLLAEHLKGAVRENPKLDRKWELIRFSYCVSWLSQWNEIQILGQSWHPEHAINLRNQH